MLAWIVGTVLFFIIIGIIWAAISLLAFLTSLLFKSAKPIGAIVYISAALGVIFQILLIIWFFLTTIALIRAHAWLFGIIFFFFLGGIIMGFYQFLATAVLVIPMFFYEKAEGKLKSAQINHLKKSTKSEHAVNRGIQLQDEKNLEKAIHKLEKLIFTNGINDNLVEGAQQYHDKLWIKYNSESETSKYPHIYFLLYELQGLIYHTMNDIVQSDACLTVANAIPANNGVQYAFISNIGERWAVNRGYRIKS
jgi:hypothetical protein